MLTTIVFIVTWVIIYAKTAVRRATGLAVVLLLRLGKKHTELEILWQFFPACLG